MVGTAYCIITLFGVCILTERVPPLEYRRGALLEVHEIYVIYVQTTIFNYFSKCDYSAIGTRAKKCDNTVVVFTSLYN